MVWGLVALPAGLLVLGLPIFAILIITSLVVISTTSDVPLTTVHALIFGSLDHFPLLAVPFFVLAGEIMGHGGIARRLIAWMLAIIGNVRGSLGLATIGTCEFFGAMSGSSAGTVAAVGRLLYPALRERGYSEQFSAGLITSSGAIAIIIPPSIAMILYGVSAEQSIVHLFTAGILPGLMIGALACIYIVWYASRNLPRQEQTEALPSIGRTTREASWALGTPFLILGGIYGGVFTPTEAAGVAVVYSALVTKFVYRELSWADLWQITSNSVMLSAQILLVVAGAGVYSWLLTTSGAPQAIVSIIGSLAIEQWQLLLVVNLFLLAVGCFIEPASAIIVLTPLLVPIMKAAGVDLIHFGIVMTVNLSIGMYTPPFGLNIFVTQSIFNVPLTRLYRGLLPFIAINITALAVITFVPPLSLWLVSLTK